MVCQSCDKLTGHYETDKETCASCRELYKIDLVRLVLELDPIYLSEHTRNKKGRPRKIRKADDRHDIKQSHLQGATLTELAKAYGVGRSTIHRIIHE